jgi:hypothetical protein
VREWLRTSPDPVGWATRIAARCVEGDGGCWLWTGTLDRSGYGRFAASVGGVVRRTSAHRAAWLAYRGDIPMGLVPDHLCRVRSCVNPEHLELVTVQVNTLRGDHSNKAGRSGTRPGSEPSSCSAHGREDGYLTTARNTNGYQSWRCRICRRADKAKARERAQQRAQSDL